MKMIKGFVRLMRFELPFSAGICTVMGQLLAKGEFSSFSVTVSGFLSIFLISASILVLNDCFDVETDKINAPHRPIPSNLVTTIQAFIFSISLLSAGIILSWLIGLIPMLISIGLVIVGFLYNRYFKKSGLPGNMMVSFSVGMTFIYGGATIGLPFNKFVLFFGLIAALIDLGEEVAADSMDIHGDLLINSKSIAIKYGRQRVVQISRSIFLTVILLTVIPFILNWFPFIYLLPIGIMDFSIAFSFWRFSNSKGEEGRKYIRWIYLGATFGLIIFLAMRLIKL